MKRNPFNGYVFGRMFVAALACTTLGISMICLAGYTLGSWHLTSWGTDVAMAVPTAFCFLCTSLSLLALALSNYVWKV